MNGICELEWINLQWLASVVVDIIIGLMVRLRYGGKQYKLEVV